MKKILFFLTLIGLQKALHAQQPYIYTIKADSVKITNTCDTAELIIENHTQNVPGFLFNKGRGRTEFRKFILLNDSTLVLGNDTFTVRGSMSANNGLSVFDRNVQLGQSIGAAGNPAALKNNREIPMNGDSLNFWDGYINIKGAPQGTAGLLNVTTTGTTWPGNTRAARFTGRYECVDIQSNYSNGFAGLNFLGPSGNRYGAVSSKVLDKSLFLNADSSYITFCINSLTKMLLNNKGNLTIGGPFNDSTNKLTVNGTGKINDTLKLPNIVSKSDTAAYKPMVVDASGNVFKMAGWNAAPNFANADLTFTGNRIHNGVYQYLNLNDFGGISMKTKSYQGWPEAELLLDTLEGFKLTMEDKTVPLPIKSALNIYPDMLKFNLVEDNQNLYSDFQMFHDNLTFKGTNGTNYSNLKIEGNDFNLSTNYVGSASGGISCYHHHDGYLLLNTNITNGIMTLTSQNSGSGENLLMQFDHADSIVLSHNESQYTNTKFVQLKDKFIFRNAHTGVLNFNLPGLPASASTADNLLVVDNNGQVKQIAPQSITRKSATVTGSSYTVPADVEVVFVNYTAGQATITLPAGTLDREITIKNLHTTNTVIISGLDTSESNSVGTRGAITVKYTGSAWVGISKY